jgi:hypothetical protein
MANREKRLVTLIKALIRNEGNEGNEGTVNPHLEYSGRCMYGDKCIGFTGVHEVSIINLMLATLDPEDDDFIGQFRFIQEMLESARCDSMGLGRIVYFPGYSVEDESQLDKIRELMDEYS